MMFDQFTEPHSTTIRLPEVTLVAIDGTRNPTATRESLARASSLVTFGRVVFFSPVWPDASGPTEPCEWVEIPELTLEGYNQFCLAELYKHITTSHCLTVQSDSWIVNPSAWDPAWLRYDYIGAPWPRGHSGTEYRVGNSGFCLRSRRLLEATASLPNDHFTWRGKLKRSSRDDVITCVNYRQQLESLGLMFAPVEEAARFSFESPTPEAPELDGQFGTHQLRKVKRADRARDAGAAGAAPLLS